MYSIKINFFFIYFFIDKNFYINFKTGIFIKIEVQLTLNLEFYFILLFNNCLNNILLFRFDKKFIF
jgi:hypothetical protein